MMKGVQENKKRIENFHSSRVVNEKELTAGAQNDSKAFDDIESVAEDLNEVESHEQEIEMVVGVGEKVEMDKQTETENCFKDEVACNKEIAAEAIDEINSVDDNEGNEVAGLSEQDEIESHIGTDEGKEMDECNACTGSKHVNIQEGIGKENNVLHNVKDSLNMNGLHKEGGRIEKDDIDFDNTKDSFDMNDSYEEGLHSADTTGKTEALVVDTDHESEITEAGLGDIAKLDAELSDSKTTVVGTDSFKVISDINCDMNAKENTVRSFKTEPIVDPENTVRSFKTEPMVDPENTVRGFKTESMVEPENTVRGFKTEPMVDPENTVRGFKTEPMVDPENTVRGFKTESMVEPENTVRGFKTEPIVEPEIDIEITLHVDESSMEDEEVKTIMESCEELDHNKIFAKPKKMRKLREKRKYEEIKHRKRSKSVDQGQLYATQNFDFSKYGISVGSGIPHDLLPGIEDYLCNVLSNENLSEYAEEQRQYFLERLDIIKLPPSIPPRPQSLGVRLYPVHSSPPQSSHESIRSVQSLEQDDFAAYQRELSRALVDPDTSSNAEEVKVYDDIDIDTADSSIFEISPSKTDEEDDESMYEIPQRNRSDSGYEKAVELSPLSKSSAGSQEQLSSSCSTGTPMPPPLPPRGERTGSDAASRGSIGSMLEYQSTDPVVVKAKLCRESSVPTRLSRSSDPRNDKSIEDLLSQDYYDGASCESLDEVDSFSRDRTSSLVKLPRPVKRKNRSNHRKLGKSLTSLWEITQPFSMLEDVVLSGELHYKSKLTWTRKIVALTTGRLVCYKSDKTDSRPSFVILLTGYKATSHKREGRRSFEVHLDNENFESHVFLVDFKEWAETWCEHINAASIGQKAPGPNVHLARGSLMANQDCTYQIANSSNRLSNSNTSLVSSDGLDAEPGTVKIKKRDQSGTKSAKMGTFAFKATQFFESLGKKSSMRKSGSMSESMLSTERMRQSSGSQSSICDISERLGPLTPDIEESTAETPVEVQKHIKHQGYLDIYSSFNKRKWGKRWCLIHENNFECYRTQQSDVCELEILLKKCVLRRAIEETKSELGLMLMENDREKITIEPVSWNELGSWLRILMKETSTPVTPPGLEGYMDDTHPYHEAVEITRLPETVQKQSSLTLNVNTRLPGSDNSSESRTSEGSRDSGIGSSVFSDDVFTSHDRKSISPQTHPCYNDSSLPRVSVCDTGAIYTQVTKNKKGLTGSKNKSDKSDKSATLTGNQSTESQINVGASGKDDERSETDVDSDKLFFDFGDSNFGREESLVDQIMSQLNTRLSSSQSPTFESDLTEMSDNDFGKRNSNEFHPNDNTLSPIKSEDTTLIDGDPVFMCSSFLEETNAPATIDKATDKTDEIVSNVDSGSQLSKGNETHKKLTATVRRHPSTVSRTEENIEDNLMELRTRLVQLKKDRISIRDRKHLIVSETDKDFLEAEYERLNRECKKVSDEINMLELHHNRRSVEASESNRKNSDDFDVERDTADDSQVDADVNTKVDTKNDADVGIKMDTNVSCKVAADVGNHFGNDISSKVDTSIDTMDDVTVNANFEVEPLSHEGHDSNELTLNNTIDGNHKTGVNGESVTSDNDNNLTLDCEGKNVPKDFDDSTIKMSDASENSDSILPTNSKDIGVELDTLDFNVESDRTGEVRNDDKVDNVKFDEIVDLKHETSTSDKNENICKENLNTYSIAKHPEDSEIDPTDVLHGTVDSSDAQIVERCAIQKRLDTDPVENAELNETYTAEAESTVQDKTTTDEMIDT